MAKNIEEMDMNKLRALAEKTRGWTKADKEWLLSVLEELGIEAPSKSNCPSCWRDAAVLAVVKIKGNENPVKGFRLKGAAAAHGVIWRGVLVSNATLDEDMAEWLKQTGFPRHQYDED